MDNIGDLVTIKKRIFMSQKAIERLLSDSELKNDKANSLLEVIAIQFELITIELRRLCEKNKVYIPNTDIMPNTVYSHAKTVYGTIEITELGWLHILLDTVLPSSRHMESSGYISDSISRLLNSYKQHDKLPFYDKAGIIIIEKTDIKKESVFDNDNKAFHTVINAVKGRLFPDDNQFELSLSLISEYSDENVCHIYVMQENDMADFYYLRQEGDV